MLSIELISPKDVQIDISKRFRTLRLFKNLKRQSLSEMSGVPTPSITRFERTGEISLRSLLKLSNALSSMDEFSSLFPLPAARSLDQIEAQEKATSVSRVKGRR
jgi:transcriptional regulator with XRE-family HTH domain